MNDFKNTHYFIVDSEPDKDNKQHFTIWWWGFKVHFNEYTWSGQCFNAELQPHVESAISQSREVKFCTEAEFGLIYKEHNNVDYIAPCYRYLYK